MAWGHLHIPFLDVIFVTDRNNHLELGRNSFVLLLALKFFGPSPTPEKKKKTWLQQTRNQESDRFADILIKATLSYWESGGISNVRGRFCSFKKKKRFSTNLLWNDQVNLCRDFSLMYTTSLELTSELIHTIQLNRNLNLVAIQWYWFMTFSLCIRNADHYNYLIRYPISLNPNYLSNAHIRWFLPLSPSGYCFISIL